MIITQKMEKDHDYVVEMAPLAATTTIVADEELAVSPRGKHVFVEVIAPAYLLGGFQFIVSVDHHQSYLVRVVRVKNKIK